MTMRWRKHGVIYCPDGAKPWSRTHAMVPTPLLLNDDVIRVFYTSCDSEGVGRPSYIDVSADNPSCVLNIAPSPLFDVGRPGCFDENGALVTSVVKVTDRLWYLYYVGFELGSKIRYRLLTGLAISEDSGETWFRYKETPILERSPTELFFRCGTFVRKEGSLFRMWYVAGSEWIKLNDKQMPIYDLKYLESDDGLSWGAEGLTCMKITNSDEHGFGRPWVIPCVDGYELHYSIRKKSFGAYRLGYAKSVNGISWERRDDELNLDVSELGWDGDAIMYSSVIRIAGKEWCFYNGNAFGLDGIGLAERIDDNC